MVLLFENVYSNISNNEKNTISKFATLFKNGFITKPTSSVYLCVSDMDIILVILAIAQFDSLSTFMQNMLRTQKVPD